MDFFAPAGRGLQHTSLRNANRRAVLTSVATNPGSSIADLSRLTGLAPQTASAIVARLETEGLVMRGEVLRGRRGQPATPLFLNPEGAFAFGIEVGWRHLDVILINLRREVIQRVRRDYPYPDAATIVGELSGVVAGMLDGLDANQRQRMVGIGLASPSRIARGIATLDPPDGQQELWQGLDLPVALEAATGQPVTWFNDGNAGCWAELIALPQPRPADLAYLHVGTFIGAGIVAEHSLWEGRHGNSANLGAMLVWNGESYGPAHLTGSLYAFDRQLRAAGLTVPTGNALQWRWQDLEPVLSQWLGTTAEILAQIVANTATVLEFDCAVIDGDMPRDIVTRLVAETQARYAALPIRSVATPRLVEGRFGAEATSRGAAALTIYRRFFSRQVERMPF